MYPGTESLYIRPLPVSNAVEKRDPTSTLIVYLCEHLNGVAEDDGFL